MVRSQETLLLPLTAPSSHAQRFLIPFLLSAPMSEQILFCLPQGNGGGGGKVGCSSQVAQTAQHILLGGTFSRSRVTG